MMHTLTVRLLFTPLEALVTFPLQHVTHSGDYQLFSRLCLFSLCVFVAGRWHSSHCRLAARTLQGGGHPVEEWSQCS